MRQTGKDILRDNGPLEQALIGTLYAGLGQSLFETSVYGYFAIENAFTGAGDSLQLAWEAVNAADNVVAIGGLMALLYARKQTTPLPEMYNR